jgi:hypothetical protein
MIHKHHFHSVYRRAFYAFIVLSTIMSIGTLGLHSLEKISYLDAFYFMSMIATAQGPAFPLLTDTGKFFVSVMSFISVGAGVAALGFLFGPFLGQIWHIGVLRLEEKAHLRK